MSHGVMDAVSVSVAGHTETVLAIAWNTPALALQGQPVGGLLRLDDGRLSFETDEGMAFETAVTEIDGVDFAQRDTVFKVRVRGQRYRFMFTPSRDATRPALAKAGGGQSARAVAAKTIGTQGAIDSLRIARRFKAALQS